MSRTHFSMRLKYTPLFRRLNPREFAIGPGGNGVSSFPASAVVRKCFFCKHKNKKAYKSMICELALNLLYRAQEGDR